MDTKSKYYMVINLKKVIYSQSISIEMYKIKLTYPKGDPMNYIAKLFINSLYGNFGMKSELTKIDFYSYKTNDDKAYLRKLLDLWGNTIHDFIIFENKVMIIRDNGNKSDEDIEPYHGMEVNIAIASTITASARVHMSVFKNNSN